MVLQTWGLFCAFPRHEHTSEKDGSCNSFLPHTSALNIAGGKGSLLSRASIFVRFLGHWASQQLLPSQPPLALQHDALSE